jgi:SAM-dependent methyltransferase
MTGFAAGEEQWRARLGTQLLRLVRNGHHVTGVDSSPVLLNELMRSLDGEPDDVRARVRTIQDDVENLPSLFDAESFDVVLCHGLLMYFADPGLPDEPELTTLLECEERAGASDPYRRVAALTHVIAGRGSAVRR